MDAKEKAFVKAFIGELSIIKRKLNKNKYCYLKMMRKYCLSS